MEQSLAPITVFPMLVINLMHEIEQGVWKVLFIHLLRMLDFKGSSFIKKLDQQYDVYHIITVSVNG